MSASDRDADPAAEDFRLDKAAVRRRFDRAATGYETHAILQRRVEQECLERLEQIALTPDAVLDIGCGPGFSTQRLLRLYPKARVFGLDIAPAMLRRHPRAGRWRRGARLVCADMEQLPLAPGSVDLVFSSLALQWSDDLDRVFREVFRVLRPGGCLLFSTFGPETLKELRAAWAEADAKPHVSAFADLQDIGDGLARVGYRDPVMDREVYTLTYADLKGVLDDIRHIGAANALRNRPRGLTTPKRWRSMVRAYEAFREGGALPATYEVNFGVAWRSGHEVHPVGASGEAPVQWLTRPGRR